MSETRIIDFHSHILPGIDDGSRNVQISQEMLDLEVGQGVDCVIATPHFYAQRESIENFLTKRERSKEKLLAAYKEQPERKYPELMIGAEVLFFDGISEAHDLPKLCIEGTNILLLEMPFCQWNARIEREVNKLIEERELRVILAHIERYRDLQKDHTYWHEILDLPLYKQMNAGAFLEWMRRRKALHCVRHYGPVLLGSDSHNLDTRKPNLAAGREMLSKKLGAEVLASTDALGMQLLEGK